MDGGMDGSMDGWTFLLCKHRNDIDQSSFVFSLFLQSDAGPHCHKKACGHTAGREQIRYCTKTVRVERSDFECWLFGICTYIYAGEKKQENCLILIYGLNVFNSLINVNVLSYLTL